LDTLEPPTPVLFSAEQAKARLREIVEGFFFRKKTVVIFLQYPPGPPD
jgi:hypothetical protein